MGKLCAPAHKTDSVISPNCADAVRKIYTLSHRHAEQLAELPQLFAPEVLFSSGHHLQSIHQNIALYNLCFLHHRVLQKNNDAAIAVRAHLHQSGFPLSRFRMKVFIRLCRILGQLANVTHRLRIQMLFQIRNHPLSQTVPAVTFIQVRRVGPPADVLFPKPLLNLPSAYKQERMYHRQLFHTRIFPHVTIAATVATTAGRPFRVHLFPCTTDPADRTDACEPCQRTSANSLKERGFREIICVMRQRDLHSFCRTPATADFCYPSSFRIICTLTCLFRQE